MINLIEIDYEVYKWKRTEMYDWQKTAHSHEN